MSQIQPIDADGLVLKPSGLSERAAGVLARLSRAGLRRASVEEVLDSADRRARPLAPDEPALAALEAPVLAGFGWDAEDSATGRWYPQGITTSQDASAAGTWAGREVVLVSWALDGHQRVRVSFAELGASGVESYRHVLLVEPVSGRGPAGVDFEAVRVHGGGIAWHGPHLYVADTLRGIRVFAIEEMLEVSTGRPDLLGFHSGHAYAEGHRFVMPQVGAYRLPVLRSILARGPRFSFLSLARASSEARPTLLSGEYRDKRAGARLVSWELPGPAAMRPLSASDAWVSEQTNLQGALRLDDRMLLASSAGRGPGRLAVYRGQLLEAAHPWATGPEDLAFAPGRDLVFSLTERPRGGSGCRRCGRVVFAVGAGALLGGRA